MKWLKLWIFCWAVCILLSGGSSTVFAAESTGEEEGTGEEGGRAGEVEGVVADNPAQSATSSSGNDSPVSVYVVPIDGAIDSPQLFILRRALKQAIEEGVDAVVLQMDTPGGALNVTLEMMQALELYSGITITYVDREAISAGSFIAVATDDIYFAPTGMMGAAAVISGSGEDINETLKQKIDSYLRARVRVLSEKYRYRADVQRAMMDADFELTLDDTVITEKGELLTLTANEAVATYGDPPEPLLARGIADDLDGLLNDRFGEGNWVVKQFELSWSEEFAKWLRALVPTLLGIGLLLIFIEFKTPGFGFFGIGGITLLLIVFASNYVAALAGYEPMILFALGLILLLVEILLLPGILIAGLVGIACVLGALVWSMTDIWPGNVAPLTIDVFLAPLSNLMIGLVIAVVLAFLLGALMPRSWFLEKLVLGGSVGVGANPTGPGNSPSAVQSSGASVCPDAGTRGVAITDLFPSGKVEVGGVHFHARTEMGFLSRGEEVEVVATRDSTIIVRKI